MSYENNLVIKTIVKLRLMWVLPCSVSVFFLCCTSVSLAYDVLPFRNGGSIEGVVEFTGAKVPGDPILLLSSETKYCGQSLPARKYLINNRRIENVVIHMVGIKAGKAIPADPVTVTTLKCEFVPHVAIGFKGKKIIMKNEDPVFHTFDVHASIGGKELYHIAFPQKGSSIAKIFSKEGILDLSCYAHPWQHAYVFIFDHPYAAVTDEKGRFVIDDIPPGTYSVEAWHEELGTKQISKVTVESGKTSTIKFEYGI
jgi:Carboxypeptidase regulatory-like domain